MMKFWTVALLLAGAPALAQANPATAAGGSLDEWSQLPRQVVTFSGNTPLAGLPQSPAITLPLRCSPQGDAFLEILLPPDFRQRSLVSITAAGKVTAFNTPDIFEVTLPITYFPAEKHLYQLIAAQKKSAAGGGSAPAGESGTTSHAPSDFYVLKYKDDGTFEDVHKLDVSLVPVRFGAFPSGKLLIGGFETVNHAPQLLVMDSDGSNSHPVDLAGSGLYTPQRLSRFYPRSAGSDVYGNDISQVVSNMQFVAYGDDLLLVQGGSDFPVLVLTEGGISRSVALKLPTGAVIESFVPSSGPNWLVRVVASRDGAKVHTMYFFDPATGEPLREVVPSGVHAWSIACEANGKLLAFKKVLADKNTDGVWTLLTASDQ